MAAASHARAAVGGGCSLPVQLPQGWSTGRVSQWPSSRPGEGGVTVATGVSGVKAVKEAVKTSMRVAIRHPWLPRACRS